MVLFLEEFQFGEFEVGFLIRLGISLLCGLLIGIEREAKNKPAGISPQSLVIGASMLYTYVSIVVTEGDPTRIAAQIVSGVGFLGAGVIIKSENRGVVSNITTAASLWYAAAIGVALGLGHHVIAVFATLYVVLINRVPHLNKYKDS